MKKGLWVVLVVCLAAPALFAQLTSQLEGAVKRAIAEKIQPVTTGTQVAPDSPEKTAVLIQLGVVRRFVKKSTQENPSLIMQAVVRLADEFFAYKKAGHTDLRELVREIETPIETGWDANKKFVVSEAIDEFTDVLSHEWGSREPTDELLAFAAVLKQYPPMNSQETLDYRKLKAQLNGFRHYVGNATEEQPEIIMQSLVYLADTYFDLYAKNPTAKTESFEAKKPELAASVAREIDQAIRVGWAENQEITPSDYIGRYVYEMDKKWKDVRPAEELDIFAKVLNRAK